MTKDPFEILGVRRDSSDEEIKRAYRELAKKYHPDNYLNNPLADLAVEKMKEINEAFDNIQKMRKDGSDWNPTGDTSTSPRREYDYRREQPGRGYRYERGSDCSFCNVCTTLVCADCCCECLGGDLIRCC